MNRTGPRPADLLTEVRIGFIRKGTTMTSWCKQQHLNHSAVRQALIGSWAGPKGRAMRRRVLAAAGITEVA